MRRDSRQDPDAAMKAGDPCEERNRSVFDGVPVGLYRTAPDGRLADVNPALVEMLGYPDRDTLTAASAVDTYVNADDRRRWRAIAEREGILRGFVTQLRRYDGSTIWVELSLRTVRDDSGEVAYYEGSMVDMTQRRQAEIALTESEERFRVLFDSSSDGVLVADLGAQRFRLTNPAMTRLLGYTEEEFRDLWVPDIHPQSDLPGAFREFDRLASSGGGLARRIPMKRKDGSVLTADISAFTFVLRGKRCLAGHFRDVTEQVEAEEELRRYRDRLRSLASELSLTQERERRRLAQQLHDSLGQALALAKLDLSQAMALARPVASSCSVHKQCFPRVQQALARIQEAIEHTRTLTEELSSSVLYELGLGAAVERVAGDLAGRHGIHLHFEDDGLPRPLSEDVAVTLYGAVRGLVVNVARHAQAENLYVSFRRDGERVVVSVRDDGVGFDAEALSQRALGKGGVGLFTIGERVRHVGGSFELSSEPGRGTRAVLSAPLETNRADDTTEEG